MFGNLSRTSKIAVVLGVIAAVGLLIAVGVAEGWAIAGIMAAGLLAIMLVLWLLYFLTKRVRDKKGSGFERGFSKKFREGVDKFKQAGKSLYEMPWYVMVGEPGAGKTEAIRHASLPFPPGLNNPRQGEGGTQDMDWWFGRKAILLDTAGRVMFEGGAEWLEFLRLLKEYRPNQPINGMILAIPAKSLITDTGDEIVKKASKIAERFEEIQRGVGARFPVYVIVTKSDLISGFREYFYNISDPASQNQMLGWSNPAALDEPFQPEKVEEHLAKVRWRLKRRRFTLLRDPKAVDERARRRIDQVDALYELPDALMKIGSRLRLYLETIFMPNEWSMKPLFVRGIYFTSAMRDGAALDVGLAEAFNIPADKLPEEMRVWEKEHSYFLKDVFMEKAFKETGLVTTTGGSITALQRRRRLIGLGVGSLGAAAVVAFSVWGYLQFSNSIKDRAAFWADVRASIKPKPEAPPQMGEVQLISAPGRDAEANFNRIIAGSTSERTAAQLHADNLKLARTEVAVPAVFNVWAKGVTGLNDKLRDSHQLLYERAVLFPVLRDACARVGEVDLNEPTGRDARRQQLTEALEQLVLLQSMREARRQQEQPAGGTRQPVKLDPPVTELDWKPLMALLVSDEVPSDVVDTWKASYDHFYGADEAPAVWPPPFPELEQRGKKDARRSPLGEAIAKGVVGLTKADLQELVDKAEQFDQVVATLQTYDQAEAQFVGAFVDGSGNIKEDLTGNGQFPRAVYQPFRDLWVKGKESGGGVETLTAKGKQLSNALRKQGARWQFLKHGPGRKSLGEEFAGIAKTLQDRLSSYRELERHTGLPPNRNPQPEDEDAVPPTTLETPVETWKAVSGRRALLEQGLIERLSKTLGTVTDLGGTAAAADDDAEADPSAPPAGDGADGGATGGDAMAAAVPPPSSRDETAAIKNYLTALDNRLLGTPSAGGAAPAPAGGAPAGAPAGGQWRYEARLAGYQWVQGVLTKAPPAGQLVPELTKMKDNMAAQKDATDKSEAFRARPPAAVAHRAALEMAHRRYNTEVLDAALDRAGAASGGTPTDGGGDLPSVPFTSTDAAAGDFGPKAAEARIRNFLALRQAWTVADGRLLGKAELDARFAQQTADFRQQYLKGYIDYWTKPRPIDLGGSWADFQKKAAEPENANVNESLRQFAQGASESLSAVRAVLTADGAAGKADDDLREDAATLAAASGRFTAAAAMLRQNTPQRESFDAALKAWKGLGARPRDARKKLLEMAGGNGAGLDVLFPAGGAGAGPAAGGAGGFANQYWLEFSDKALNLIAAERGRIQNEILKDLAKYGKFPLGPANAQGELTRAQLGDVRALISELRAGAAPARAPGSARARFVLAAIGGTASPIDPNVELAEQLLNRIAPTNGGAGPLTCTVSILRADVLPDDETAASPVLTYPEVLAVQEGNTTSVRRQTGPPRDNKRVLLQNALVGSAPPLIFQFFKYPSDDPKAAGSRPLEVNILGADVKRNPDAGNWTILRALHAADANDLSAKLAGAGADSAEGQKVWAAYVPVRVEREEKRFWLRLVFNQELPPLKDWPDLSKLRGAAAAAGQN